MRNQSKVELIHFFPIGRINLFLPISFQGVEKACIGNEWVKTLKSTLLTVGFGKLLFPIQKC